jgi:alpha-galactosidase
MKKTLIILLFFIPGLIIGQKFPNLAPTPPMGWNSWNTFKTNINEKLIKDVADAFVKDGYKDAGYNYIIIDDCWSMKQRDEGGNLVADPAKFPGGMKALADYIHSKGLKFGIYGCAGTRTCGDYPGSKGFEMKDAKLFASWGVDYLKYDWCNTPGLNAEKAYTTMRDALYATGRPIVLGICEWGDNQPWLWAKNIGHLWRISGDIAPCFDCVVDHGTYKDWGVMKVVYMRKDIRKYSGPEGFNDFDMMEVGTGMTESENRSHFTLWSMLASALILGNDIRNADPATVSILTNKNMISINQDPLGIQAFKYKDIDSTEVWVKPLKNKEWAVCFLNRKKEPVSFEFNWSEHKINDPDFDFKVDFSREKSNLFNVWTGKQAGTTGETIKSQIAGHDVLVFRLSH